MGEVRITEFFIRLWQIKKDRLWKTDLSDTSTGTLVFGREQRNWFCKHPLDEQISITDGNVFLVVQKPKSWICERWKETRY